MPDEAGRTSLVVLNSTVDTFRSPALQVLAKVALVASLCLLIAVAFVTTFHVQHNSSAVTYLHASLRLGTLTNGDNVDKADISYELIDASHLIIVATHAVLKTGYCGEDILIDDAWVLLDYQRNQGLPEALVSHIHAGVTAARKDPNAVLILSGGHTRNDTPNAEAMSYYKVAEHFKWWAKNTDTYGNSNDLNSVRRRTFVEDYSRDSFENVLFSIARFREVTGHYPTKISVVSFSFKEARFRHLHRVAVHWPSEDFDFIGIDPSSTLFDKVRASEGERVNAREPFQKDPYGCTSEILRSKREGRNPYHRTPPYSLSCPEIAELLQWCSTEIYPQKLPWELDKYN